MSAAGSVQPTDKPATLISHRALQSEGEASGHPDETVVLPHSALQQRTTVSQHQWQPRFDADHKFIGYYCVARDITSQVDNEHSLRRFRAAMDMSGDMIYLVDRASCIDGQWIIIGVTRNITRRKNSELASLKLQQMFSALSETNAAILRADSPQTLYQSVCEAAIKGGKFNMASRARHFAPGKRASITTSCRMTAPTPGTTSRPCRAWHPQPPTP